MHNQPTKPSKGGGGGGAAAIAKGKNTADDGARMGEDFATVSKAEQIMDDKAPFNPNIAAALDIPEPKVISFSTYNDPNFLAGVDPISQLDESGNGRNDISNGMKEIKQLTNMMTHTIKIMIWNNLRMMLLLCIVQEVVKDNLKL